MVSSILTFLIFPGFFASALPIIKKLWADLTILTWEQQAMTLVIGLFDVHEDLVGAGTLFTRYKPVAWRGRALINALQGLNELSMELHTDKIYK